MNLAGFLLEKVNSRLIRAFGTYTGCPKISLRIKNPGFLPIFEVKITYRHIFYLLKIGEKSQVFGLVMANLSYGVTFYLLKQIYLKF